MFERCRPAATPRRSARGVWRISTRVAHGSIPTLKRYCGRWADPARITARPAHLFVCHPGVQQAGPTRPALRYLLGEATLVWRGALPRSKTAAQAQTSRVLRIGVPPRGGCPATDAAAEGGTIRGDLLRCQAAVSWHRSPFSPGPAQQDTGGRAEDDTAPAGAPADHRCTPCRGVRTWQLSASSSPITSIGRGSIDAPSDRRLVKLLRAPAAGDAVAPWRPCSGRRRGARATLALVQLDEALRRAALRGTQETASIIERTARPTRLLDD